MAGPPGRSVEFQDREMGAELPPLVSFRVRTAADRRSGAALQDGRPAGAGATGRSAGVLMEQVLVSGSAGFIGGYVVEELLNRGYAVVGLDDFSKYGKVRKSYDDDPRYRLVEGDARDAELIRRLLADCDHFIAGAAMIGGISYFHTYAYDLLATNDWIVERSDRGAEGHVAVV